MAATQEQLETHEKAVRKHVRLVRKNGKILIHELQERLVIHDASKLEEPEASVYAENFPAFGKTVYDSPEYHALLEKVKPALDSHYSQNRHHPEHFPNGINDFDLVDLIEMICDWSASVKKNKNGNIHRSVEINAKRFGISPQLAGILTNTVERYLS
jgi:ubiquinone/menaquinone biosynthesis C-methylase UbiE